MLAERYQFYKQKATPSPPPFASLDQVWSAVRSLKNDQKLNHGPLLLDTKGKDFLYNLTEKGKSRLVLIIPAWFTAIDGIYFLQQAALIRARS